MLYELMPYRYWLSTQLTHEYPSRLHSLQSIVWRAAVFVMLRLAARDTIVAGTTTRGPSRILTDGTFVPHPHAFYRTNNEHSSGTVSKTWRPAVEA